MISAVQEAACTVVISRGQSRNPQKRGLEQGIAEEIANIEGGSGIAAGGRGGLILIEGAGLGFPIFSKSHGFLATRICKVEFCGEFALLFWL